MAARRWRIDVLVGVAFVSRLVLAACAAGLVALQPHDAQASEWRYNKAENKAFVVTTRVTIRTGRFFSKPAGIQLQCFKKKPVIQFKFSDRVGSNRSASVSYRFDDKPARDGTVKFLSDYKSIVIEDRNAVRQFVAELRSANKLVLGVDSLINGNTRAEIQVQGASPAIAAVFAACPI